MFHTGYCLNDIFGEPFFVATLDTSTQDDLAAVDLNINVRSVQSVVICQSLVDVLLDSFIRASISPRPLSPTRFPISILIVLAAEPG